MDIIGIIGIIEALKHAMVVNRQLYDHPSLAKNADAKLLISEVQDELSEVHLQLANYGCHRQTMSNQTRDFHPGDVVILPSKGADLTVVDVGVNTGLVFCEWIDGERRCGLFHPSALQHGSINQLIPSSRPK